MRFWLALGVTFFVLGYFINLVLKTIWNPQIQNEISASVADKSKKIDVKSLQNKMAWIGMFNAIQGVGVILVVLVGIIALWQWAG